MRRQVWAAFAAGAVIAWAAHGPGDALAGHRVGRVMDRGGRADKGFNAGRVVASVARVRSAP